MVKAREKAYRKSSPTYKILRALVQRNICTNKREFTKNKLNNKQNTRQWWKTLSTITKPTRGLLPDKHLIDDKLLSTSEFCENIDLYYTKVGGTADESELSPPPGSHNCFKLEPLTPGEVKLQLKRLDCTKATSTNMDFSRGKREYMYPFARHYKRYASDR